MVQVGLETRHGELVEPHGHFRGTLKGETEKGKETVGEIDRVVLLLGVEMKRNWVFEGEFSVDFLYLLVLAEGIEQDLFGALVFDGEFVFPAFVQKNFHCSRALNQCRQ